MSSPNNSHSVLDIFGNISYEADEREKAQKNLERAKNEVVWLEKKFKEATHIRRDTATGELSHYKVTTKVQVFKDGEWIDVNNSSELNEWLMDLSEIKR